MRLAHRANASPLRSLSILAPDDERWTDGPAIACETDLAVVDLQHIQQGEEYPGAAYPNRVPDGDASAMHVEPGAIQLGYPLVGHGLRGEGLVDFEIVD